MSLRKSPVAGAVLLALLLSACSGGLKSSAPSEQLYVLRPAAPAAISGAPVQATLQLLRPVAEPGLDTARIALLQPGNRLDYYAGGRWSGPLVDVMESLLARTLRGSGRFAQVSSDAAGMGADFALAVTLRRFEAEYDAAGGPPTARVVLECTVSSRREHRQIAGFDVAGSAPAQANRLGSVVLALEQAANEAAAGVVDQAARFSAAALAAEPGAAPRK
jgi:cholesterol transport system auxiliary component